jgi:sterol desaturase/sphingolipid hydroxylase (fatty acid hydroxylase superfamily)
MDTITDLFAAAQQWLFEAAIQPVLFAMGMGNLVEDAFDATMWLLVGVIQIVVLVAVIAPMQRWKPVEQVTDHRGIRLDMIYTVIHRLGIFRVALFFAIDPLWNAMFGSLHVMGLSSFQLDQLWPGVTDGPIASLLLYLLLFDLLGYLFHRAVHSYRWLWALHSVHHSQRQMTMWSDDRNHLLEDLLHDTMLVIASQLIGVAPGQFIAIVAISNLIESFSHANVRVSFGRIGEKLIVGPRFHRLHHAIGLGHESRGRRLGGHNFAVLFPIWDILFGTAHFGGNYEATGIRDQLPEQGGRDYGEGFFAQQWLGLKRMVGRG